MLKSLCLCLLGCARLSLAKQVPLAGYAATNPHDRYDHGSFVPFQDLSLLSEDQFTTLDHPVFPNYNVRIKKSSSFCDPIVRSYTGYIDIDARHIFFYFFESRNDPDKDDVIFWTSGGPGCSSSLGLFMEMGPCKIRDSRGPRFNPESWNANANVFFVDQPVGVGFSYADFGETVTDSEQAGKDVAAFIAIFFEHFTKFKGRAFHMAGESYAGRYIPVFASQLYDQNTQLVQVGFTPVNLTSVMIGNGVTDMYTMVASYYDYACTSAAVPPILDIETCVKMKRMLPRCLELTKKACIDRYELTDCQTALTFCTDNLMNPFFLSKRNPYDVSRDCEGKVEETLCYPVTELITQYLSKPDVRFTLGVDPILPSNFSLCSSEIGLAFATQMDVARLTYHYVAALLERGVKALIYVGTYDWICNYIGNEAWTLNLEWTKQKQFASQPLREWFVNGRRAGMTRNVGGLTFATVDGAGHLVPYDKPKESLELVKRWLGGRDI